MGMLDGLLGAAAAGGGASLLENLVVGMLQHQGGQGSGQQMPQQVSQQAGGMGAGMAGGLGGIAGMLGGMLANQGGGGSGLQGLISSFTQNGMGNIAQSWVGNGANEPVSPEQVQTAFGDDKVQAIADHTGMPKQDVLSQLSQMLPGIVDRMTSNRQA